MPTLEQSSTARFPKITEAGLNELRKRIAVPITDTVEPWNYEATRDAIRHYAHGIGDDNPLWTDPHYAERTRHLVEIEQRAETHRGELSATGTAVVELPSRSFAR
jgi:hypothetical protein